MYHDLFIDSPNESGFISRGANHYKIKSSLFEQQVKYVKEKHLDSIVLFTFDDGGKSMYELAAPILEKYDMCGVFCIPTSYIGESNFLSKQQIFDLSRRGHVIASHSDTHPQNMRLLEYELRYKEWSSSIEVLTSITGMPVRIVSIPNGYYSQSDVDILESFGVSCILSSTPSDKNNNRVSFVLGRYAITSRTNWKSFKLILSSQLYRRHLTIKQYFLDCIKRQMGFKNYSFIKKKLRLIWK